MKNQDQTIFNRGNNSRNEDYPLLDKQFMINNKIGEGRFSNVYKAFDKDKQKYVALKMIKSEHLQSYLQIQNFLKEIQIISELEHSNIIKIYYIKLNGILEIERDQQTYCTYYVMKLAQYGEFFQFIQNGPINQQLAKYFYLQIISILEYLHQEKQLAHCDIKPENLLIDKYFQIILADFGSVQNTNEVSDYCQFFNNNTIGSTEYNPPEITNEQYWNMKSFEDIDIFQSGVVLFQMIFNSQPFYSSSYQDPYYQRFRSNNIRFWQIFDQSSSSEQIRNFIMQLLEEDVYMRSSLQNIRENEWIQTDDQSQTYQQHLQDIIVQIQYTKQNSIQKSQDQIIQDNQYSQYINYEQSTIKIVQQINQKLKLNKKKDEDIQNQEIFEQNKDLQKSDQKVKRKRKRSSSLDLCCFKPQINNDYFNFQIVLHRKTSSFKNIEKQMIQQSSSERSIDQIDNSDYI